MKLVILDRDGTINSDSDDFVKTPEEWLPLPGALEAIARLSHAGWHVVVASNQSGLGRGLFDVGTLNAMHAKMLKMLALQGGRMDAVGASSIDIHLGDEILIEEIAPGHVIDYRARTQPKMTAHKLGTCVVVVCARDIAETKAKEGTDLAKEAGFPLLFQTEPEE